LEKLGFYGYDWSRFYNPEEATMIRQALEEMGFSVFAERFTGKN
jgi:hypothetical protein